MPGRGEERERERKDPVWRIALGPGGDGGRGDGLRWRWALLVDNGHILTVLV